MAKSKARGWICTWLLALVGCAGGDVTAPEPQLVWSRVPSGTVDDLGRVGLVGD